MKVEVCTYIQGIQSWEGLNEGAVSRLLPELLKEEGILRFRSPSRQVRCETGVCYSEQLVSAKSWSCDWKAFDEGKAIPAHVLWVLVS